MTGAHAGDRDVTGAHAGDRDVTGAHAGDRDVTGAHAGDRDVTGAHAGDYAVARAPQSVAALDLPPILVITGTGTGVGKTVATAAIAAHALARGLSVCVVKPVQTGVTAETAGEGSLGDPPDVAEVRRLLGPLAEDLDVAEFVRLPDPLAPQQAARRAGVTLPPIKEHAERIAELSGSYDVVLVEGAGGVLVRLDEDGGTIADLAGLLPGAQAVIATEPRLGTLNITELTAGALRARGVRIFGLIVGRWPAEPELAEAENLHDLPELAQVRLLGVVHEGLTVPPVLTDPPAGNPDQRDQHQSARRRG